MATKLRPLSDRVIVKQSEAETKTASGIVLPDTAKEKPTKVERTALQNAAEVAILLLTTDCIVVEKPKEADEAGGGHHHDHGGMGGMGGMDGMM